jgi:hypothetical protein
MAATKGNAKQNVTIRLDRRTIERAKILGGKIPADRDELHER